MAGFDAVSGCVREVHVILGPQGSLWPNSKEMSLFNQQPQGTESCQQPHGLGSASSPGQGLKSDPTTGQHLEGRPGGDYEGDKPVTPHSDS